MPKTGAPINGQVSTLAGGGGISNCPASIVCMPAFTESATDAPSRLNGTIRISKPSNTRTIAAQP